MELFIHPTAQSCLIAASTSGNPVKLFCHLFSRLRSSFHFWCLKGGLSGSLSMAGKILSSQFRTKLCYTYGHKSLMQHQPRAELSPVEVGEIKAVQGWSSQQLSPSYLSIFSSRNLLKLAYPPRIPHPPSFLFLPIASISSI